jgi:hypothetical protein
MICKYAHDGHDEQQIQEGNSQESRQNDTRNCRAFQHDRTSQRCCSRHQVFEDAPVSQGPEEPAGISFSMRCRDSKNEFIELKFGARGSEKHVALRQKLPVDACSRNR